VVRSPKKRNLIAAVYRVHGDDLLPLVLEWFARTGTTTNLLGELRELPPRDSAPLVPPRVSGVLPDRQDAADQAGSRGGEGVHEDLPPNQADADSAWCGCPEEELRPGVLYCDAHRPAYGSKPKTQYDRKPCNPAAARFFAAINGDAKAEP